MSFYTDEQLSMILSAMEAAEYWNKISTIHYGKNEIKNANMAYNQSMANCDWLDAAVGYFAELTLHQMLRRLEKLGLA